jgi:hypothetical protein
VETAIAGGDKSAAQEAMRAAQPRLQRAARQGRVPRQHGLPQAVAPLGAHQGDRRDRRRLTDRAQFAFRSGCGVPRNRVNLPHCAARAFGGFYPENCQVFVGVYARRCFARLNETV